MTPSFSQTLWQLPPLRIPAFLSLFLQTSNRYSCVAIPLNLRAASVSRRQGLSTDGIFLTNGAMCHLWENNAMMASYLWRFLSTPPHYMQWSLCRHGVRLGIILDLTAFTCRNAAVYHRWGFDNEDEYTDIMSDRNYWTVCPSYKSQFVSGGLVKRPKR